MGTRGDMYPLGTTEDCNNHVLCPANAKCVNNTHCTCLDGYQSHGNCFFTDTTEICDDINECLGLSPPGCGLNAKCINMAGSYYCTCIDGYEPSSGKANFTNVRWDTCKDIDECQGPSPADCGPHAQCTNVPGNYSCSCIHGYEPSSGKANFTHASENTCQDIDECQGPSPADCGPHANCTNVPGSYYCTCIDDYESSSGKVNFTHASENTCQGELSPGPHLLRPPLAHTNAHIDECQRNTTISLTSAPLFPSLQVPSMNSSAEFERIKETCRNFSLQGKWSGRSSSFSSFFNSTLEILMSTCGDGSAALSLENVTLRFNALLNSTSLWDGGDKRDVGSAVTVLLQSVELAALATALRSPGWTTQNVTTESMAIQTRLITGNCSHQSKDFTLTAHEEMMDMDCDTVTGAATQAGLGAAAFISYSTLNSIINATLPSEGNLPAGGKLEKSHLNSRVVSGAIGDGRPINLSRPANFTLSHRQVKKEEEEALCVYWKVVAESGSWSPDGCTTVHINSTHTNCSCDHLSSFAILMAPTTVTESDPLTIITYVGLTLSLPCLFLAILTFLLCRSIRNISTSLHLQLCLCLFLADLLFLIPVTPTGSRVACAVIAGLLHYLFLACFSWMLLEGLHLFLTVRNLKVMNYTSASRFKKRFMYPFGYGFPALVVAISAAVNPKGYGTSKQCWLSQDRGFHWSFLGPVCAIILINITFFAQTLWILRNKLSSLNADVSTLKNHRLLTFKAIAQLFILGCTWSLGLLQIGPAATVMAYLFTIVNSLQGAFIFLVHCLLNRQVREEYRRWIKGF
ncbi:adhesion G protein-coupled receptor E3-like, partial [Trachemys scripta elegans]|uniref:adhesion G protein-coupled receptor E3-like n=1 Tax=Trachemys scripta elegans TaxID=31138 RepID=UPI0015565832